MTGAVAAAELHPEPPLPDRRAAQRRALRAWWRPRVPLLVATAMVIAVTAPESFAELTRSLAYDPLAGTIAVVVWILYGLPLFVGIVRMDYFEREPGGTLGLAAVWGALVATGIAVTANTPLLSMWSAIGGAAFADRWASPLTGPTVEETIKAAGVVVVVLLARRAIRTPLDGMVIGACVGLGFQIFEDILYTLQHMPVLGPYASLRTMLLLRGFAGGLWSHAVYTGISGYGIGYAFTRRDRPWAARAAVVVGTGMAAWGLHFLWNSVLITDQLGDAAMVVKGVIALGLFLRLLLIGQVRDSALYLPHLAAAAAVEPVLASPQEIEDLATYESRRAARRAARLLGGRAALRRARDLQRAQAATARALAVGDEIGADLGRVATYRARQLLRGAVSEPVVRATSRPAVVAPVARPPYRGWDGWLALACSAAGFVILPLSAVGVVVALVTILRARRRALRVPRVALLAALLGSAELVAVVWVVLLG